MTARNAMQEIDLDACAREPIHRPGRIQPHGALLAVEIASGRVVHASTNFEALARRPLSAILDRELEEVWPATTDCPQIARLTDAEESDALDVRSLVLEGDDGHERRFDVVAHRSGDLAIIEFEEQPDEPGLSVDATYALLRRFIEEIRTAARVEDLCDNAARAVRAITGFDRVMIYRFDAGWNGTVVAESRSEALPSYLNLRFPSSDIPAQARELYRRNRLRMIPDARYEPVPVEASGSNGGRMLDMSFCMLRSVAPVHLEYMRNMGTAASMSVSILDAGRLWGLISCHHASPKRSPVRARNACDFLAQILSLQIGARERADDAERRLRLGTLQANLLARMAEEEDFEDGLLKDPSLLLEFAGACGAAVVTEDSCRLVGRTPDQARTRQLYQWLAEHHREDVFATDCLARIFPAAEGLASCASGLLAVSISKAHASYILWFRPEAVETVAWGGDPNKPVDATDPGRLHPRRSFAVWRETVRGSSAPWRLEEIDAAKELRNAVLGIVLRRAEEMASLSEELRRSNEELEAFSYSVSHDLRAPFRHIVGYSELLRRHESSRLSERGQRYVETIIESAYLAGTLVDSLLSFSQMGRTALNPRRVDLDALVREVRASLERDVGERRIVWRIDPLGEIYADPIMLRLVVENLLSNALKYSRDRVEAVIEVGRRDEGGERIYFVRDNGAGFDMAYVDKLFGVFQRLHRMEEFEGTGIGLANVRRIVERHGGRTWAEGAVNEGATFYFTLPRTDQHET